MTHVLFLLLTFCSIDHISMEIKTDYSSGAVQVQIHVVHKILVILTQDSLNVFPFNALVGIKDLHEITLINRGSVRKRQPHSVRFCN